MGIKEIRRQERAEKSEKIVELYKKGATMEELANQFHISQQSIKQIVIRYKVYIPQRYKILNGPNPEEALAAYYKDQEEKQKEPELLTWHNTKIAGKLRTAVLPQDIERLRKSIKEGSRINIGTNKAMELHEAHGNDHYTPHIRTATVISTKNPVFCIVRIEKSGLTEHIRWADMEIARRKGRKYV